MKTTQGKAVSAYITLMSISRKPMNSFTAYKLFRLKKALSPAFEFQSEEEQKMVEEFGGQVTEAGIVIADAEKRKNFGEKHKELDALECEISLDGRISMVMKEFPDITLADLEALDDFIDWRE